RIANMASWDWLIIRGREAGAHGECEGVDLVLVRYRAYYEISWLLMESLKRRRLWKGLESKVTRECCFVVEKDAWLRVGILSKGTWGCWGMGMEVIWWGEVYGVMPWGRKVNRGFLAGNVVVSWLGTGTIDTTSDQQVAMDEALVPHAQRLRIGRSNFRLLSDIKSKESTLQLVYDVMHLCPFFKAFLVTADVPEIYMLEF
nr:hypothetical protein [Tanacetum cinerariifolium]